MEDLGVPCPLCGSVEVVVGPRADQAPPGRRLGRDPKGHVPQLHDCSCRGCRHRFQHDFAFSR